MGKISVDAFLREYGIAAKQKDSAMETFIKKHVVVDYIDFMQKDVVCTSIIKTTCYVKSGDKDIVKINSIGRYMLFIMNLIKLYTDIDIEFKDDITIQQYDKLNKVGAINTIISAIPESEYSEFSTILNMKMDDFRDNEYSIVALLYNIKNELVISEDIINSAIETIVKENSNE